MASNKFNNYSKHINIIYISHRILPYMVKKRQKNKCFNKEANNNSSLMFSCQMFYH